MPASIIRRGPPFRGRPGRSWRRSSCGACTREVSVPLAGRWRSIARVLGPSRPLPRPGSPGRRIAHFGGGFETGRVVAVHAEGRRLEVRGEGGGLLEFVLSPATARFVSAAASQRPPPGAARPRLSRPARRQGASTSGKCSAQCSRSTLRTACPLLQGRPCAGGPAARAGRRGGPGDHPADGELLEQQLARPLPVVLAAGARSPADARERIGVLRREPAAASRAA